jgi:hypothetical protein
MNHSFRETRYKATGGIVGHPPKSFTDVTWQASVIKCQIMALL